MNLAKNVALVLTLSLATLFINSCKVAKSGSGTYIEPVNTQAAIKFQPRKDYTFQGGKVHFNNQFLSARFNNVTEVNDSTYTILIEPENTPVNPSPWYAFKIWTSSAKNIAIKLKYARSKHRYDPKISYDGSQWRDLEKAIVSKDSSEASFRLLVSTDTVTVAAQEIINSTNAYAWMDSLSKISFVNKQVIGYSLLGKPIVALNTTGSNGKKIVVVLSRQHPPEVTGYMAMKEFVRTVVSSNELAQKFRAEYELVVVPLMNPDGVDEGNWRHSAAGVDLNRDWEFFRQPETRAVKDFLFKKSVSQQAKIDFGIDFHSTWYDVFYTNSDTSTNLPGLTGKWLRAFAKGIPGFKPNVKPSGNGGNVSKSWLMRAFGADALTYEVGDNTSRDMLKTKGRVAAEKLMELLLAEEK